ncbi:SigE family RNA polymerase sigma factor [Couchioplanes caeruleus]|uniref:RNA polymerase subunit sigma n=2 Tax=Couchioplanes caeruleus TaxID=56438 RepID=A0A1K0FTZ5_9ACTN|nr:SigE family RNA polymerase sigma factor [Couchioplanes caeruleus]OJF16144.1 RNA polymerase subunit sigma [Couchioplanes caeruleus subsp. caeruleus]ROP34032.1 RNA polymerase sigma-70 factor (sigma-E family) [Couchioplanes caeruleus]
MSDDASAFHAFFERHHAELARLAYLMTGEASAADDLAADALTEVWRHWSRVAAADDPAAYARGIVANLTRHWVRRRVRERHGLLGLTLLGATRRDPEPDVPAVLDVRRALSRLPHRRRACVVLRYSFDLSESEVAKTLGISVGAVKSQTSRGARQLAELLGGSAAAAHHGGWEAAR